MPSGAAACRRRTTSAVLAALGMRKTSSSDCEVGDEVVDDAAGLVAAHRVLRLAGGDPPEVVGQAGVDEVRRAGARDRRLAQVADVEDADALAHGGVLADDAAAGVLDRHRPSPRSRPSWRRGRRGARAGVRSAGRGAVMRLTVAAPAGRYPHRWLREDAGVPHRPKDKPRDDPDRVRPFPERRQGRRPGARHRPDRRAERHWHRGTASTARWPTSSAPRWPASTRRAPSRRCTACPPSPGSPRRWSCSSAWARPPRTTRPYAPEVLRRAAGAAVRALTGRPKVALSLPGTTAEAVGAAAEGALLGAYEFAGHRGDSSAKSAVKAVVLLAPTARDRAVRAAVKRAGLLGRRAELHPRPGQHRPQRALPPELRRVGQGPRHRQHRQGRGDGREGPGQGRVRRHHRCRPGLGPPAADRRP